MDAGPTRTIEVERCLRHDASGEVYAATLTSAAGRRRVDLRFVDPHDLQADALRADVAALAALGSPAIPRIHEVIAVDDRVVLVTEPVEGATFAESLAHPTDPIPMAAALLALSRVAHTLHTAWSLRGADGPLGRRLPLVSASNIHIGRRGEVQLLEVGPTTGGSPAAQVLALGLTLYACASEPSAGPPDPARWMGPPQAAALLRGLLSTSVADRPGLATVAPRLEDLSDLVGGASLSAWCRQHAWRPAQGGVPGPFTGRTITMPATHFPDPPATTRPTLAPLPGAADTFEEWSTPDARQPPRSSRAPIVVGAVAGLVLVGGVLGIGWTVALGTAAALLTTQAPTGPAVAPELAARVVSPADTDPPEAPPPHVEPAEEPVADPSASAPRAIAPCDDLTVLEPRASVGALTDPERACLQRALRDTGRRQTERNALGRVLLADLMHRCSTSSRCQDYEREQRVFFEQVDRSDADLMAAFAAHLSRSDDDATRTEAQGWAERALERKDQWRGARYLSQVDALHKLIAVTGYARWEADPRDDGKRLAARDAAVEWANVRIDQGRDATEAVRLCVSANGSADGCDRRTHDPSAEVAVLLVSFPVGATLSIDGRPAGATPATLQLAVGAHVVRMESAGVVSERRIEVGADQPARWIWRAQSDAWEGSF